VTAQAATPLNDARERERAEEAIEYGYTHVEVDPHRLLATLDALRATPTPDTLDVERLADMAVMSLGSVLTGNDYARYHALFRAKFVDRLNRAAEYRVLAAPDATREETP